ESILSKDFLLPLEFLEKVYQSIQNFNHALDNDEFVQDETLRGVFAYRGKFIADVLRLRIQDKARFITAYIKAYYEWLLYLIEKLEQKYKSLLKV
ncbi:motility associated factor glycosyltransferase family protein, partial [Campylobacter coli]|nr:motility associated factor glycosyltransferase family protein [Campylobacter coli]